MKKIRKIYEIIREAYRYYRHDSVSKFCAALSYYTLFALPPLLLLLLKITGFFINPADIETELLKDLTELFGKSTAIEINNVIQQMNVFNSNGWITLFSTITLIFGASGIFSEIQSTLHIIWEPIYLQQRNWKSTLLNRMFSLLMIILCSALVLVFMLLNTVLNFAHQYLTVLLKSSTVTILSLTNSGLIFIMTTILFLFIYRILPSVKLKWKYIITASLSASVLFLIGKYIIGLYLAKMKIISIYGAAGTIIVLLVWVYYMSALLYFGAEVAKAYYLADKKNIQKETEKKLASVYEKTEHQ
jgi:membrane protein